MTRMVAFCGIDGCGKTTLIKNLLSDKTWCGKLSVRGEKVNFYCKEYLNLCNNTEYTSGNTIKRIGMTFDFLNHYTKKLHGTDIILCDRYDICYRVLNRVDEIPREISNYLDKLYDLCKKPDLYIYLDVEVGIAGKRLERRGNREVEESDLILESMRKYYDILLKEKDNVVSIDANADEHVVFEYVRNYLEHIFR